MLRTLLVAASVAVMGATEPAFADFIRVTVTLDELGNGFQNYAVPNKIDSKIDTDPISGIKTLVYLMPFGAKTGDLFLTEPDPQDPSKTVNTDLLRWVDGGKKLFIFSDKEMDEQPNLPMADVGVPAPRNDGQPVVYKPEGPVCVFPFSEEINGICYYPEAGNPGYPDFLVGVAGLKDIIQYRFTSDVPEPNSVLLLSTALLGSGLLRAVRRHLASPI